MKKTHKQIALLCFSLILVLVLMVSGLQILESTVFSKSDVPEETRSSKTVIREDAAYFPRQDITTVLIMGIDQEGPVEDSGSYRNQGESDVVMLAVFDETNETYSILALNRDTMVEMPVLGLGGRQAGTFYGQLALSHTYGSGLEDSAENTRKTVSDLLNGIRIDYYVAMNMDAIGMLNDAVGGVTVTVTEDFSAVDASIPMGEVTLDAAQARAYVQIRKEIGDQLNISRMQRHKDYINGFMRAFEEKMDSSESFALSTYDEIAPYMVTDCSVNTLSTLVKRFSEYELQEIVSPEGENILTEEYFEFHLNEEELYELVLRIFYAPK